MRSRGYKAVGKKELKEEVLEFMEESMEENGYTVQFLSDSLEISTNLARESLFRLIKDDKVYRFLFVSLIKTEVLLLIFLNLNRHLLEEVLLMI